MGNIDSDLRYKRSMELCHYIGSPDCSPSGVARLWRSVFNSVLAKERFTQLAIDYMWENLAQGNWKRFHQTDDERHLTSDEWLLRFCDDVRYCSDRWSLDRLIRCHWLWLQYTRKAAGR